MLWFRNLICVKAHEGELGLQNTAETVPAGNCLHVVAPALHHAAHLMRQQSGLCVFGVSY